jgi:hypothetical protein
MTDRSQVLAILESPALWQQGDRLEQLLTREPSNGGRPRAYPPVMVLLWNALKTNVFGSSRHVEAELTCPDSDWWDLIRKKAQEARPGIRLPAEPMRRHHVDYLRERYMLHDDVRDALAAVGREVAAWMAVEIGVCDPEDGGSLTHPNPDRVVSADGKVITSRFRPNRKTRRRRTKGSGREGRSDPDADFHITGAGDEVHGTKFVLVSTRGDARNQRIILDVPWCPDGDEARVALDSVRYILPHLPGVQLFVYDGALRGVHIREVLQMGVAAISRMSGTKNGGRPDRYYGPANVRRPDGSTDVVELHLVGGLPHIREVAVDGSPITTPLIRALTFKRPNKAGWRWYNDYEVPTECGGGIVRLRLDQTAEDIARGFNREEHLRVIPIDDPDFPRLYGRRNDSESGNRVLDDSMWRERAHTVSHARQHLDMLAWALGRNAMAWRQHRLSSADPPGE